jgi:hypothetical protein
MVDRQWCLVRPKEPPQDYFGQVKKPCKMAAERSHGPLKTGISAMVEVKLLYLSDARVPLMMCPFTSGP